jgi:hypothetical protein
LNFLNRFSKKSQISSFIKIRPMGDEFFFYEDRRTDMIELIVAFRNFANAPKTECGKEDPRVHNHFRITEQPQHLITIILNVIVTKLVLII